MKHIKIELNAYTGTLHKVNGTYEQDMRHMLAQIQALGTDLVNVSDEEFDSVSAGILIQNENIWVWDTSVEEFKQVANPDWPYEEE
jgi:hypothetical protein